MGPVGPDGKVAGLATGGARADAIAVTWKGEFVHRLKPLTIAGLVTAYEQAIDESSASYDSKHPR